MDNDIQNWFLLLYHVCNKVEFRIFLCSNIEKWRSYGSLKIVIIIIIIIIFKRSVADSG